MMSNKLASRSILELLDTNASDVEYASSDDEYSDVHGDLYYQSV